MPGSVRGIVTVRNTESGPRPSDRATSSSPGGAWAADQGIDRVDILKVDVEGCEVEVLEGLADLLPTVKVLFVEYDSRHARRALGRLLDATHELYIGNMFLDQGECTYLRADVAELEAATEHLRRAFAAALAQPTP